MSVHQIDTVRIDIPLSHTSAYFFVTPDQAKWDPWWLQLYVFLTMLAPAELEWTFEPVQGVYVSRPLLCNEDRERIMAFLRTAPPKEAEEHRTLKRALNLTPERQARIELVYFASPSS